MWRVKIGLLILLFLAMNASSDSGTSVPSKGAEFVVQGSVLQQLRFSQKQTTAFDDEGRSVTPNLDILVTPSLAPNAQGASVVRLNVSISGTTSTSESRAVGLLKRKQVNVGVVNQMTGHFEQDLQIGDKGLMPAQTRGGIQAGSTISASNTFGLFNRLVNRVALNEAKGTVGRKMPQKINEADDKVKGRLSGAANQAAQALSGLLASAEQMLPTTPPKDVYARFESTAGDTGRMVSQVIDGSAQRQPEPKFDFQSQAATRAVIHQDLLTKLLNQQLAGRELKFSEFQKELCSKLGSRVLDFCNADLPTEVKSTAVQFSSPKAIEFFFEKGKIRFRMHALYKKRDLSKVTVNASPALGAPDSNNISLATEPYTVDVTYRIGELGGELEVLKVAAEEKCVAPNKVSPSTPGPKDKLKSGWHFLTDPGKAVREICDGTVDLVAKSELEKKFAQLFKPKINLVPVSFPLKVHSGDNISSTMTEAGTLFPLELKAENGWLAVSTALCSESYHALGLTPTLSFAANGGPGMLYVKNVAPFSPAWQSQFREGDRIESYGVPGERPVSLMTSAEAFINFTAKRSEAPSATSRTLEISGVDGQGNKFKRTVSLCPRAYDHRGKAQAAFSKLVAR